MLKRITAILVAALMLLSLFSCEKKDDGVKEADHSEINSLPVIATENFEVTVSMMTYFLNSYYRSFISDNQLTLGQLGLDPSRELDDQMYSEEYTWLDYFLFYVSDALKQQIVMAEAALGAGFELSEEDLQHIEDQISYVDEKAANGGNSTDYLIKNTYGECVNESTLRKCLQLTNLAKKYTDHLVGTYTFTDKEFEDYFEANKKDLLSFSYIRYQVLDAELSNSAKADFTAAKTEEEFVSVIKKYASETVYDADEEYLTNLLKDCYVYGAAYTEDSEFADWAFEKDRKAYDVYTEELEDGRLMAAMALPASDEAISEVLWRDITPVHNIESIYFAESVYETADAAKEKAEEVFKTLDKNSDFSQLIEEYAGGSTSNLIKGASPGAIEDWVFDESRKTGDIGIVTVKNAGTYIIRLLEDGIPAWKTFTLQGMSDAKFNAYMEDLLESTELILNNDAIGQVTPITYVN